MLKLKEPVVKKQQSQSQSQSLMPQRQLEAESEHEDEIRLLAYRKWEQAGSPPSDGVQFWLDAENEILWARRS